MTNNKIDAEGLLANTNIVAVIEKHVALNKKGGEWIGLCPFHDDTKKSLNVNERKQVFKCFACGEGGDSIAFLTALGYSFRDACTEISGGDIANVDRAKTHNQVAAPKQPQWKQIDPPQGSATPSLTHYRHGTPSKVWAYRRADGHPFGYIARFDTPEGKEVLPHIYATDGNRSEWRWQGFDKPRSIYNLHALASKPDAVVMVFEGEKTADAAQQLFPDAVAICWQGGAQTVKHTDWTPLEGRKVILWPDNDAPGVNAMIDVSDAVNGKASVIKFVTNPPEAPEHWDIADAEWTPDEARAYCRANMGPVPERTPEPPKPEKPKTPKPPAPAPPPLPPPPPFESPNYDEPKEGNPFFRFLGFTKDGNTLVHNFFCQGSQTIISLSPSGLSKNNLIQIAPINWWENEFPSKRGIDMDAAVNWLVQTSNKIGTFSERYVRGRGAWVDKDNIVIHAGNRLVVNNVPTPLGSVNSKYVYEASEELGFQTQHGIGAKEASRLLEITKMLNWERDISAYLLAGWCVVAPMCGALNWRPHIWLTGAAGTGKSWVFKNIVRRLMENIALAVQGETSEAGLRQMLGHDALPVVFDEAEGEDKRSQERMQSVLSLMRAASADDGGVMAKGTAGGSAVTYRIRSCFAFASIAVQIAQQSDRTRVTVLGLTKNDTAGGKERWKNLQLLYHEIMTNEFVRGVQARSVQLLPVILDNARTFSAAAAIVVGEQRAGDQLGAMLAGAYSLRSDNRITLQDAIAWLEARDLDEERALDKTRDEVLLMSHLLEQITTVEASFTKFERNIGELVAIAANLQLSDILPETAHDRVKRLGFKIDGDYMVISNTADWVRQKLANTPWAKNHNKILMRIEGARHFETTRFGAGIQTRAVGIPLSVIFDRNA